MSKRFSVTVPDAIGQAIEKLAEAEGSKPASTASFIVERAIKDAIKSGEMPAEWAVLEMSESNQEQAEQQNRLDAIDSEAIVKLMLKLKKGGKLAASDISLLENILDLEPRRLADLTKNGNNDDAKSRVEK